MPFEITADIQTNSSKAFEILRKVLTEIEWNSDPDDASGSFYVDFGPPHLPVSGAIAAISQETNRFLFYVNIGALSPPQRRDEVVHFIALVNWGLSVGNFEMDYGEGFVRFKASVDFTNTELSEALIRNTILAAMSAIEVYVEPLMDVLGRNKSAQEAFADAKAKQVQ